MLPTTEVNINGVSIQQWSKRLSPWQNQCVDPRPLLLQSILSHGSMFLRTAVRPLLVADEPTTPCTYSGIKKIPPNRAIPKIVVISVETLKMLFLNRLGSIIGCPPRLSSQAS